MTSLANYPGVLIMVRIVLLATAVILLSSHVSAEAPPQSTEVLAADSLDNERLQDWAALARYRAANSELLALGSAGARVVFMGDSITAAWANDTEHFFPGKRDVGRGISGQTTPQMLVRFRQDVVALMPRVVVINGGTNDIAGNTGPSTLEMIEDNLKSMVEIAEANGIAPVLASVTPTVDYPWSPGLAPAEKIVALNDWMKSWCSNHGCIYCDYFDALANAAHGMKEKLSSDGVHPTAAGYAIMQPIAERAIARAMTARHKLRSTSKG